MLLLASINSRATLAESCMSAISLKMSIQISVTKFVRRTHAACSLVIRSPVSKSPRCVSSSFEDLISDASYLQQVLWRCRAVVNGKGLAPIQLK